MNPAPPHTRGWTPEPEAAGLAALGSRDADARVGAEGRLLEREAEGVAQAGAGARAAPSPEGVAEAEEVAQDVFAQVWREAARYDSGRSTVAGWIVMLTRTRAIDRLRARRARPDLSAAAPAAQAAALPATGRTPEAITLLAENLRQVRGALAQLPDQIRSLIELAYYEGLTHSEIAERTGIPLGTVKTRLRTAMGTLRSALP